MNIEKLGELAMEYISEHPLYASTSGITYEQAIAVAEALSKDWQAELVETKRLDSLKPEQLKAELVKQGLI